MKTVSSDRRMITRLMFRLLPIQILLAAVNSVNGIVSSLFASNCLGSAAMSAVGLYAPVGMLVTTVSSVFVGGATILCGKYLGQNRPEKVGGVFSLDIALTVLAALAFTGALGILGALDLTGFLTGDPPVRRMLNLYFLGQAVGVLPLMLGGQLAAFLSLENKTRVTLTASLICIGVNVALNFLFLRVLRLGVFALALASSLGMWVFWAVQSRYFLSGRSFLRFSRREIDWAETGPLFRVGVPGAVGNVYQTVRGLAVNRLLNVFVGSAGVSAFAACNTFLGLFWTIPFGMMTVSRMLISVSVGEEDRQTLTDVMRTALYRFLPLMCLVSALLAACAVPMTRLYFRDAAAPVYAMTALGFRLLPACMPLSLVCLHVVCYGQAAGKQGLVHVLSLLDGVVCVAGFSALLIPVMGIGGLYVANILNGVVTVAVPLLCSVFRNRRLPRTMDELLVLPEGFGAGEEERMDLSVRSMEEVVTIARSVQEFCLARGAEPRRAYLAGLFLEEMAGNVVSHGFGKDRKPHSADVRVVCRDGEALLRIKDDCVPFDPAERLKLSGPADPAAPEKNLGIRLVFGMAEDIDYQNLLGLNVLTIRL